LNLLSKTFYNWSLPVTFIVRVFIGFVNRIGGKRMIIPRKNESNSQNSLISEFWKKSKKERIIIVILSHIIVD
jgi:hypothetical protein